MAKRRNVNISPNNISNGTKHVETTQMALAKAQGKKTLRLSAIEDYLAITVVTVASFATRLYHVDQPPAVCWDETHFGKMASWYLNRTFFFDVHPPLGKMLIALSGHLSGYDGKFAFEKPGDVYTNWTQYVGMRIFCAILGALIAPIIFRSTKSMTNSTYSATLAGLLIAFDNGMVTLTRYILLDSPLLFFISLSILGMSEFSFRLGPQGSSDKSFSTEWWFWLLFTGLSISCAFSVKFVGLFTVALVGLRTVYDLWIILGDTSKPIENFIKHFVARAACLIIVPALVYAAFFWIHFKQLDHTGNGDGFYSSSFQSQLIGNSLHNSSWPAHLAYGAEITLKNNRIGGAYLHSHWHLYPEGVGARQQQVTAYSHKDSNNKWLIKKGLNHRDNDIFVRSGDIVMLEHIVSKRNLHSHLEEAPLTKRHYQVTCYGENGVGDANDYWIIQKESQSRTRRDEDDRIYTVKTRFLLTHYLTKCALHSHSKQLPKWGYEQHEVTCNPKLYDKNNYWNIEDNYYPLLPNVSFEQHAPSFLDRFLESHAVMLQGNSALKPKEGEVTSRPWEWPFNYRGQMFSSIEGKKIYLLGNLFIWFVNIIAIPAGLIGITVISTLQKASASSRSFVRCTKSTLIGTYQEAIAWSLLGWALHYIPFYFMGRVLYFHHYFPAFLFSCTLTAIVLDALSLWVCIKLKSSHGEVQRRRIELLIVFISIVLYIFFKFSPLTYGTSSNYTEEENLESSKRANEQQLSSLKWLDSWEF